MALREKRAISHPRQSGTANAPRLRLKREAPVTGYVDGAWWPRSDDLPTELPDLLEVLSVRLGAVARVTYNLAEWAKAPRRVAIGGRIVRLDGYHRQPHNTLGVLDAYGTEIVLLIVPVHTEPDRAHNIVMAAAVTDNASSVDALLSN
jgi:hypothetical protein